MKQEYIILAIVLIAGLFVRIYPTLSFATPLKYDTYYHARVASLMETQGPLITQEPWPEGGRPHFYPPLYHLLLILGSFLTFNTVLNASRFILPFFAALIPLTGFWFVRELKGDYAALIAAFLLAFNSFFLDASYDSPELFGLLLLPFIAYFLLKEKYLQAGLALAISFMFSIFFGVYASAAFLIFLIYEGKFKKVHHKLFGPSAIFLVLWYLPRLGDLGHLDVAIGSTFISKSLGAWALTYTPVIIAALLILFILMKYLPKIRYKADRYDTLWTIWTIFFTGMFLTFLVTPVAYPWRMPLYISMGFTFLIANMLANVKYKSKNVLKVAAVLILVVFTAVPAAIFIGSGNLRPALDQNEYQMMQWMNATIDNNSLILSDSVFCSNIITLTGKKCALDINFESIPDKNRWIDYTNFFESPQDAVSAGLFLEKYSKLNYVVYANKYGNRNAMDVVADRIYSSWECDSRTSTCFNSTVAYKTH